MSRCITCLIHCIDKGLRAIPGKATRSVIYILARENPLNQGG